MWTLQYHHFAGEFRMIKTKPVKMDDARYLGKSPGSISFSNLAPHGHYKKEFTSVFSCDQMPPLSSGSVMLGILCILKQKKTWNKSERSQWSKFLQGTFRCIKCFKSRRLWLFTLSHSFRLATCEVCWLASESRYTCKDIGGVVWLYACTLTGTRFHSSQWDVVACLCLISQREIIFKMLCPNFSNGCPLAL